MNLGKQDADNIIARFKYIKNSIKLIYTDSYKKHYYYLLAGLIVNYKEQIYKSRLTK